MKLVVTNLPSAPLMTRSDHDDLKEEQVMTTNYETPLVVEDARLTAVTGGSKVSGGAG